MGNPTVLRPAAMNALACRDLALRLASLLLCLLLTACVARPPATALVVHSPPAPVFGSVPIAAYDDFARAVMRSNRSAPAVAQAASP